MKVTQPNIKLWSKLGPRAVYGSVMHFLAESSSSLIAVSSDLGSSSGLERFRRDYPDQFINTGIAEQNMIGFASGISKEGFNVFASSFAPFLTMRAAEQVRMNLGYMQSNVKLIAIGSGLSMGFLGNSHFGLEDIAIMRSIPGVSIVNPADCLELVKVIEYASKHNGPMYVRLTGAPDNPIVYTNDYRFVFGEAVHLKDGSYGCIVATGSMVASAVTAANLLSSSERTWSVYNMHTISPLDTTTLDEIFNRYSLLVTVEEHFTSGGLGTAISEYKNKVNSNIRHLPLGLPTEYCVNGEYSFLLEYYGLTGRRLAETLSNISDIY